MIQRTGEETNELQPWSRDKQDSASSEPLSCSHVHSSRSLPRRRRQSHPQPPLPRLHRRRETLHFWSGTPSVLKAMFACPRAHRVAILGPLTLPAPKPLSLRMSPGSPSRSSPTSSAPMPTPNQNAPNPLPPGGSATWQSSLDTSRVWAQKVGSIDAGSDPSCPNTGAIPCLLLQSILNQKGPTGGRLLATTTYIQRLNTNGGSAPTYRLHCGSDSARAVHFRLRLLPPGRISTSQSVGGDSDFARGVAPLVVPSRARPPGKAKRCLGATISRLGKLTSLH